VDDWEFYQDSDGQWFWRNVTDTSERFSLVRFSSFVEVIAGAIQAGFVPGSSNIASVRADRRAKPRSSAQPVSSVQGSPQARS